MLFSLTLLTSSFTQNSSALNQYNEILEWGSFGFEKPSYFSHPQFIALDDQGNVYITELGNKRIQKFSNNGDFIETWGKNGKLAGEFHYPSGIAVDGNFVYVADRDLHRIQKFDLNGTFVKEWGSRGINDGQMLLPNGVATGPDGSVYVADTGNQRIQKFTSEGEFVLSFGSSGQEPGKFLTLIDIEVDNDGNLYVSDKGNEKIEKFDSSGNLITSMPFGTTNYVFSPQGIAIDPEGAMFIVNSDNNRILHLEQEDVDSYLTTSDLRGPYPSTFTMPNDVALDNDGNLFVVDAGSHKILKFETPYSTNTSTSTSKSITEKEATSSTTSKSTTEKTSSSSKTKTVDSKSTTEKASSSSKTKSTTEKDSQSTVKTQTNLIVSSDLTKPVVVAPNDMVIEATGILTPVLLGKAIANDDNGIKSLSNNAPEEFPLGTTIIIWTAIDNAGNMAYDTQSITVNDTVPPVIDPLPDVIVEATSPDQNIISLVQPNASDIVGVMSITSDAPPTFTLGKSLVNWTAKDIVGNTSTYVQKIVVADTIPPKLIVPQDVNQEALTLSENIVELGQPIVTDNGLITSVTNNAPEFFTVGNTTVTWNAVDSNGNAAEGEQIVTIIDSNPPELTKPDDIIFEAVDLKRNLVDIGIPTVNDIQPVEISNNAPDSYPIGETVVTWSATDSSGNNANVTQIISIVDTTVPTFEISHEIVLEATGLENNVVNLGDIVVNDLSGILSISNDAPETFSFGNTTVTWSAIDNYGNKATFEQKISVIDTVPPSILPPKDIVVEAADLNENLVDLGQPIVEDLTEIASISNDAPDFFPVGLSTVTWSVSDSSGNISTATQTVTVIDTVAPELIIPENLVVEASDPSGTLVDIGDAIVNDVVGIDTVSNDAPELFELGTIDVTWTATDLFGNIVTSVQVVTVLDTTSPSISAPSDITFEATASQSILDIGTATADDIIGVDSVSNDAPSSFPLGSTTVTWTATDAAGNSASDTQVVTVVDTIPPTITAPDDISIEATSPSENIVELNDKEKEQILANDLVGIASITNDAPSSFPYGSTTVTWTATDAAGNSASDTQVVTVVDTIPPTIIAPDTITVEATSKSNNTIDYGLAIAHDNVEVTSISNDAPDYFSLGMTTITWSAIDKAGNESQESQQIFVVDQIPPELTIPSDIVFEAQSFSSKVDIGTARATDIISVSSISNDAPEFFSLGETIITWTAVDTSGNTVSDTQLVTVLDTTSPSISAPSDITFEATASQSILDIGTATADDIIGVDSVSNDAPSSFPLGSTTVTWTATDAAGNSASDTQVVTVVDTIPPTITAPDDISIEATSPSENIVELNDKEKEQILANDLVGIASITNDAPSSFPYGSTTVTWTATDAAGNSASDTQVVTVVDTIPPTIIAPQSLVVEATGLDGNVIDLGIPLANDDAVDVVSLTNDSPDKFALGETLVTWTATDAAGNSASDTQLVSIVDTVEPEIITPSDIIIEAVSLNQNIVDLGIADATDAVGISSISNDAPEFFSLGETTVTWTATDAAGNSASDTQVVTVVDTIPPTIIAPQSLVVEATGLDGNVIDLGIPLANDDAVDVVSLTNDSPDKFALGETLVTWTATDAAGNSASDTQLVSIVDTVEPEIITPSDIIIEAVSLNQNIVDLGIADATDAVGISSISNDAPEFFSLGETTVTWTATDLSGNSVNGSQLVTIVDTTSPTISILDNVTLEATSSNQNTVSLSDPVTQDLVSKVTITNDAPEFFSLGETTVTWTATDETGNSDSITQKITILDTTAPELIVPGDIVIDATSLVTAVDVGTPTLNDLTDSMPTLENNSPVMFPLGETIITWTASDIHGNSVIAEQTITVHACGKPVSYYNMIQGTIGDDIIAGTDVADLIFALGGDDIVNGANGNDCIFGGEGDDILYGSEGDDGINGDAGSDIIRGQSGNDSINGNSSLDLIDGGADLDTCNTTDNSDDDLIIKCE